MTHIGLMQTANDSALLKVEAKDEELLGFDKDSLQSHKQDASASEGLGRTVSNENE